MGAYLRVSAYSRQRFEDIYSIILCRGWAYSRVGAYSRVALIRSITVIRLVYQPVSFSGLRCNTTISQHLSVLSSSLPNSLSVCYTHSDRKYNDLWTGRKWLLWSCLRLLDCLSVSLSVFLVNSNQWVSSKKLWSYLLKLLTRNSLFWHSER